MKHKCYKLGIQNGCLLKRKKKIFITFWITLNIRQGTMRKLYDGVQEDFLPK